MLSVDSDIGRHFIIDEKMSYVAVRSTEQVYNFLLGGDTVSWN